LYGTLPNRVTRNVAAVSPVAPAASALTRPLAAIASHTAETNDTAINACTTTALRFISSTRKVRCTSSGTAAKVGVTFAQP
jgi:hypothetical protein